MNNKYYGIISFFTLLAGILLYAFYNEIIIIRIPKNNAYFIKDVNVEKVKSDFFFFKDNKWYKEQKEIILSQNKIENLTYLINTWLTLYNEEKKFRKINLQNALIDSNSVEAFISFDRSPFIKENSTYEKLMWIESLLKTISESKIKIQSVRFLVHHKPLNDFHLDFSKAWPLSGFIKFK